MQTDNEKYNATVKPNTAFLNELKEKLPEFFTKDGSFDLDKFKDQLKEKNINELSEGYQLDFIGKDYARRQAGEIPSTVIVPDEEQNNGEGKNSKNLFFTGDNLEVLRHLQTSYANKIDVIYIDPPYNTGSDGFVYPDSFEYNDEQLKSMFGLDDEQVERLKSIQGKSSHSAWLTFMYPRLVLAKKLLSDNGLFFISIDENEYSNLKIICDEIFGEGNYQTNFIWRSTAGSNTGDNIKTVTEYVLTYSKDTSHVNISGDRVKNFDKYKLSDSYFATRGGYLLNKLDRRMTRQHYSESLNYAITMPNGDKLFPGGTNRKQNNWNWRWSKNKVQWGLDNDFIVIKKSNNGWAVYFKQYAYVDNDNNKIVRTVPFQNLLNLDGVSSNRGTAEVTSLFNNNKVFDYPKPVNLISYLLKVNGECNSTVLDFFAGSSTTAEAVLRMNAEDAGNRRFIMVQLPEKTYHVDSNGNEKPTKGGKTAYDAGFKSIDEISRERIRRAAKKIREDNGLTLPENFDGSFKHYRIVKPTKQTLESIEDFDPNTINLFSDMVNNFSSDSLNIPGNATGEQTILTTWLLQDGYSFDEKIHDYQFNNYHAYLVEDRLYLIDEGWGSTQTKELLNKLGKNELHLQSIVLFGYSFNISELRELESGLKQLDNKVNLIKRY